MQLTARGAATPDEVWDRYLHPARWSEWSPQIRSVDTGSDRLLPGLTGTVHGPLGLPVRFVVESVDERSSVRKWSWHATVGPITLRLHHEVIPRPGSGTETTLTIAGFLPAVVAYLPLAQIALVRLVRP